MDYLLKASAVLFIFYACYQLFLQKETFFQANRWFLLAGLVVACIIPMVVIPVYIEYTVSNTNNFIINYDNLSTQVVVEEPFDYMQLIIWTYFAGILFFFGKLIVDFLSLRKVLNSSKSIPLGKFKLLETNRNIAPFSFFDRIVYNPEQFEKKELTHVINHEKVHVQQWHSIDTIISQLACILFWFNPIVWLYKKALQQNLEFIADQKAQHVSLCEKSYQTVLLKTSIKNHQLAITNNFYTSLIKKRIVMLHKSKSRKINQFKLIVVFPLLAFFMMSFNTEDVYIEIPLEETPTMELIQTEDIEQIFTKDMSDDDLIIIKKELANKGVTFDYSGVKRDKNGNIIAIKTEFEYHGHSGTYNTNSDKAMEPFIFKSNADSFVVGNFTDKNPKTYTTHNGKTKVQSSGSSNVYVIEDIDKDEVTLEGEIIVYKDINNKTVVSGADINKVLFILDGKKVSKSVIDDMKADELKSVEILKGKKAIETYGNEGKHGVIIISTGNTKGWSIGMPQVTYIDSLTTDHNFKLKKFSDHVDSNRNEGVNYEYYDKSDFTENNGKEPLYIINGKEVNRKDFKKINPDNIESMNVLKGKSATTIYGERGKNGIILLTIKPVDKWKIVNSEIKTYPVYNTNDTTFSKLISTNKSNGNKFTFTQSNLDKEDLLFIVDGIKGNQRDFRDLTPDLIKSMNTLNGEEGLKMYGEKGKNGVIIIVTKSGNHKKSTQNSTTINVEEVDSPWKIVGEAQVTGLFYVGDDGETSAEFVITKTSTDNFLEKQKQQLKKQGIEAKFSKVKRNKAGEITSIKIALDDNDGRKSSASWKEKDQAIPDIVMGKSSDDKLYVRAIGH